MIGEPVFVGAVETSGRWLAVCFAREEFDHCAVFDGIGDLWVRYEERAERILVDVPVGLRERDDAERRCDVLAREVLDSRSDTVFTPPVREAARKRRYPAAERVHERKTGQSLSKRAFALGNAITAVDDLLQEAPEAQAVLAEANPEVCFRAFAGAPMEHSAAIAAGYAERMRTLAEFDPDAAPTVQAVAEGTDGAEVTVADVLTAVALGYTARPGPGSLRSLPPEAPTDEVGLPMRLLYRSESPLLEG